MSAAFGADESARASLAPVTFTTGPIDSTMPMVAALLVLMVAMIGVVVLLRARKKK